MKSAIVTGASSGIGLEISKVLLELNCKVFGVGRNFDNVNIDNVFFHKIECDLLDRTLVEKTIKEIKKREEIKILVNNAGVGYFALHEELNSQKIHEMIMVNLEIPIMITNLLLRELKKNEGFIINISSITAKKSSPIGAAYSATKAGLTHFGNSLFEEVRKYGVKIVTIHPDMTKTNFYRNSNFKESDESETHILSKEVAEQVKNVLSQRDGVVINDITIRPQKHKIRKK